MKRTSGITLIALIITIIVMLILAGIGINALFGDYGIINMSKQAVDEYNNKVREEQELLGEINNSIKGDNESGEEGENPDDQWVSFGEIFQDLSPWEEGYDPNKIHIGDFIAYDAGTWTTEEINNIKVGLKGNEITANGSTDLPTGDYQFGGFTAGMSKNKSVTQNAYVQEVAENGQKQALEGWRVFDYNEDTGAITLISAGSTEYYNHPLSMEYTDFRNIPDEFARGYTSVFILTNKIDLSLESLYEWENRLNSDGTGMLDAMTLNLTPEYYKENYTTRNWDNYLNKEQGAVGATILTAERTLNWYTKGNFDIDVEMMIYDLIEENIGHHIVLINGDDESGFWIPSPINYINSESVSVVGDDLIQAGYYAGTKGIRPIITLSPNVKISKESIGTKKIEGDTWGEEFKIWDLKYEAEGEENKDTLTVKFILDENNIVTKNVNYGGTITPPEINGEVIEKWGTIYGGVVDLNNITEDMYLYPAT